jgi:hypothetical protein
MVKQKNRLTATQLWNRSTGAFPGEPGQLSQPRRPLGTQQRPGTCPGAQGNSASRVAQNLPTLYLPYTRAPIATLDHTTSPTPVTDLP